MRRLTVVVLVVAAYLQMAAYSHAAALADYLITKAIAGYAPMYRGETTAGSGVVTGADHFRSDHSDTTYETGYFNSSTRTAVNVQVTQHAGCDSDRWLLHEIEMSLTAADPTRLGRRSESAMLRKIGRDNVLCIRMSGGAYKWISNNVVVTVSYEDRLGTKPEPVEIVNAYLVKFPSTIPSGYPFNKGSHERELIKTEMDRRLWLGGKLYGQVVLDDPKLYDKLREAVESLKVFLDYREKYFGMAADDEKLELNGFLTERNKKSLRAKLDDYQKWWSENRGTAIMLP